MKLKIDNIKNISYSEQHDNLEENSTSVFLLINNQDLFDENEEKASKYLILETNFKIYAYTTNSFEKSILSLFSKTVYEFPNMIKAYLDEESVESTFRMEITSSQIVKY